jgi:SAM-dependent methyltransferase
MTSRSSPDPQAFKAAMRQQWDRAADGWDRHGADIGAWLQAPTEAMLGLAGVAAGSRVLDVAAGAGEQTLTIARRVGERGFVLATDLSPALVQRARDHVGRAGHANVRLQVADAEQLPVADASFDTAVCRLGLMLLPDPLQGLKEMHRAVRPGGAVCTVVFSEASRNPCIATLMATACRHAGLPAPDPARPGGLCSLGQPERIDGLFLAAGFRDVATIRMEAPFRLPSVDHYLAFVRAAAGPVRDVLGRLEVSAVEAAWDDMAQRLAAFTTPLGWEGPNELLLTVGRRPRSSP